MNLNYCPEQVTGRYVLLVCVSPLLIVRLLESRCNDVSFAQKHTSDRYGVGLQTDCTLRETTAVLAPMSSGFEFDARRLTRSRVSVCTWSCLPAVRFDRGSDEVFSVGRGGGRTGPPAGGSLCLVYARFMCTPHHSTSPHTVPAFCVLRQSAATNPLHVVSSPLDTLVVGASRQIFRPRRPQHHATLCRTRD